MQRGTGGPLPVKAAHGDQGPPQSADWTSLEADFFAREADLYRSTPADTFDDELDS